MGIYEEAVGDIEIGLLKGETRDELRRGVDDIAAKGAAYATSLAPVGKAIDRDAAPGTFKNSIVWKQIPDQNSMPAAQIYSDAIEPDGHHYSIYVEYGSRGHQGAGVFGATTKYIQHQVDEER
jgi:hypothetical protein